MFVDHVEELVCPKCSARLSCMAQSQEDSGEVIEGVLTCSGCRATYPVRGGIARFVDGLASYNASWNYKWTAIDQGRGLNHRILDKADPAYTIHDIYDRNSHDGRAFARMRGGRAIEIGCGVGQYVVKSLLEHAPARIVALDLTEGVDTCRAIIKARYPEHYRRVLFVQASVFAMPLAPASFDYVYSLGVLHHTGRTMDAIQAAIGLVKPGGDINFWIYAAATYPIDAREPGRRPLAGFAPLARITYGRLHARGLYWLFGRLSPAAADRVLQLFASDTWLRLTRVPVLGMLPRLILSPVAHPDRDYRRINLFDGYVNNWAENWSEHEIFPLLRETGVAIKGISSWRLGIWGRKEPGFYDS